MGSEMHYLLIFVLNFQPVQSETIAEFPTWDACRKEAEFQVEHYKTGSWGARYPEWACVPKTTESEGDNHISPPGAS
jgi:hypothetical protein